MKTIPYGRQYINNSDIKLVASALKENFITTGDYVKKFENDIKNKLGSKFALTCSSGTSGLHLAFKAIDLKKNDIIVMPAINFIAAYSMSKIMGAKIFLADVDKFSGQMTPETLQACIKKNKLKKIKAIITMYMGGYPENVLEFYKIKKKYRCFLIEDACHALGAKYKYNSRDIYIGSCKHSDIAVFSLHPVKTITTGEGGLITTNSKFFYNRIKLLRSHGIERNKIKHWQYDIKQLGFNYRLSDVNCALGISQLKKIHTFIKYRKKIYNIYKKEFQKYSSIIKVVNFYKLNNPSYHLILVSIDFTNTRSNKDKLLRFLKDNNVLAQYHYIPIFDLSVYRSKKIYLKSAIYFYKSTISLPIYYKIKKKNIKKIASLIINFLKIKNSNL
ncbi:WecE Predicted pyridoxal phosphate-dependent enzyme apparently involved in regulation of cell wall biogenesis [Candidatus Pelagibacterales bacterium]